MAAEKVTLYEIDINIDLAVKDTKRLKEEIELLKKASNKAKEEQGELSEEYIKYQAELKATQKELRQNEKLTQDAIKADKSKTGSIEKLRKELSVVSVQWAKLSKEERENTEDGLKLTKQKKQLTDELKAEEKATGDSRREVGNYSKALEGLDDSTGGVIGQVKALGKQFLVLLSNPIVAFIAAIVGAATLLVKAFGKSQEGADTFAKAFDAINASIDAVVGRLAGLAGNIKDLITGKQSFAEFKKEASGTFKGIQEEIKKTVKESNRLFDLKKGLAQATVAATTYIAKLNKVAETQGAIADNATLSFQEREEAARLAEESLIEARALEFELAEQAKELFQQENELKAEQGLLTDELRQQEADLVAAAIEAETALEVTRIEQSKRRAELAQDNFEQELDILLDIADASKTVNEKRIADENITFNERVKILDETKKLLDESFDQQIALFERENQLSLDRDALLTLNNEQVFEYLRGLELSEIETNRLREVIIERKKAEQDLADSENDINAERIENEEKYFAATQKLANEAYAADIARLKQIEDNELKYLNDKQQAEKDNIFAVLNLEKKKLEIQKKREIETAEKTGADVFAIEEKYAKYAKELDRAKFNEGLSVAADFAGNIAELFGEQTKVGKAAAAAQIAIQTAQAAIGAYASLAGIPLVGPVLGAVAAGAAIAYGAKQIQAVYAVPDDPAAGIVSTPSAKPPSTGSGGGGGGGSSRNKPDRGGDINGEIGGGIISRTTRQRRDREGDNRTVLVLDDVENKQRTKKANNNAAVL